MRIEVSGQTQLRLVATRLRGAANRKDLVREMRKGILDAVPALKDAVRESAREYLPDNYAAELVPTLRMTTATNVGADSVSVVIHTRATGAGGNARHVGTVNDGIVKHPVHGRTRALKRHALYKATSMRNPWVSQKVQPGFVTRPMTDAAPKVRAEIEAAVSRVLNKIIGG